MAIVRATLSKSRQNDHSISDREAAKRLTGVSTSIGATDGRAVSMAVVRATLSKSRQKDHS